MKVIKRNIWDYYEKGWWVVVLTNGYIKTDGSCVMGRGLALQAKKKLPLLAGNLGSLIMFNGNKVFIHQERVITFPVKNNWREKANLTLIEKSCKELKEIIRYNKEIDKVVFPKVGCGNGKLKWEEVEPVLDKYFNNEKKFIVVDLK